MFKKNPTRVVLKDVFCIADLNGTSTWKNLNGNHVAKRVFSIQRKCGHTHELLMHKWITFNPFFSMQQCKKAMEEIIMSVIVKSYSEQFEYWIWKETIAFCFCHPSLNCVYVWRNEWHDKRVLDIFKGLS